MMHQENANRELDSLFTRYRQACGSPEPDPNFMPMLWQKIEARQSRTVFFERIARAFVAATMAACCLLGGLLAVPSRQQTVLPNASYVEDIATANAHEAAPFLEPVHVDFNLDLNGDGVPDYQ